MNARYCRRLLAGALGGMFLTGTLFAQPAGHSSQPKPGGVTATPYPGPAAPPKGITGPGDPSVAPRMYMSVTSAEIMRDSQPFRDQYVQLADVFGRPVDRFPFSVLRGGISPNTHYGFRTDRAEGSNMLVFVTRDNKDAEKFFGAPVEPKTPIHLMGRVGPAVDVAGNLVTTFLADRVARGNEPPAGAEKKKTSDKQKDIAAETAKLLDEIEGLVRNGKTEDALSKLAELKSDVLAAVEKTPELKAQQNRIMALPEVVRTLRNQEAVKCLSMGDAASLKEDFVTAVRSYRYATTTYPETEAAQTAAEKLARLQSDPKASVILKEAATAGKHRSLLAEAERLCARQSFVEARALCDRIIREYPDSDSAKTARTLRDEIARKEAGANVAK